MIRILTSALAAGLLFGSLGGAKAADAPIEPDRYEAPHLSERRWQGEVYEVDRERYGDRYADAEDEDLLPPAPIGPPRRYGPPAGYGLETYERRFAEERVVVERPRWQRPVVAGRLFEDEEECRIFIRRRVTPFGDVVVQRRRVCD